jgi:hypothetical protein
VIGAGGGAKGLLSCPPPGIIDRWSWLKNVRAQRSYRDALGVYEDSAFRRQLFLGRADLRRRWSFLCRELLDWDRGLKMLGLAEDSFTTAGQWQEVGRVHLARGQLLWERDHGHDQNRALELLGLAVEMIDPEKSAGAFEAAEHNCEWALALHPDPDPEALERTFKALQRSRLSQAAKRPCNRHRGRQRFGRAQLTIPDAKRRYLQGKVLVRLCEHDEARPFLESSRLHLMVLGNYPRDVFAVTLDLAECYLWIYLKPCRRVATLLAETFAACPTDGLEPEAQAALALLCEALEAERTEAARQRLMATSAMTTR